MKISKALIIAIITVMFASCVTPENHGDNSANTIQLIRNATLKSNMEVLYFSLIPYCPEKVSLNQL